MSIIKIQDQRGVKGHYHYEVDSSVPPIGVGGMGQVRRGILVNENTGGTRNVAIKFLFDDLSRNAVERSKKEASIRIKSDNLVEMIDFVTIDEEFNGNRFQRFHVVSELLEGVRLMDIIKDASGKVISNLPEPIAAMQDRYNCNREEFAIFIVKNVLAGLMALHDNGYIHRDVDPSNIMLTIDNKVKLIDFGLVRTIISQGWTDEHLTSAGQFIGKTAYAAPELVTGDINNQNVTTDLYAVGILLFRLLTGKLPFTGTDAEVMKQQISENVPVEVVANKRLQDIIAKATAKSQDKRYQSAAEFRAALDALAKTVSHVSEDRVSDDIEEVPDYDSGFDQVESITSESGVFKYLIWIGVAIGGLVIGMLVRSFV